MTFQLLAAHGLNTFPIQRPLKTPALKWEHFQSHKSTPDQHEQWATANYNTGIATGAISGVVIFDLDSVDAFLAAMERGLPPTLTFRTPRGWHHVYQHPGGHCGNRANVGKALGVPGWDIRGDGGYVVGPGSYYVPTAAELAAGKVEGAYTIESDLPVAAMPDWLAALLVRPEIVPLPPGAARVAETTSPYGLRAMNDELAVLAAAQSGEVNDTLNRVAFAIGQLVGGGEITHDDASGALDEALAARGIHDEPKTADTVARAYADGQEQPRSAPPAPTALDAFGAREFEQPLEVPAPPLAFGPDRGLGTLIAGSKLGEYFRDVVYVCNEDAMWVPGGVMLKKSPFDAVYGRAKFFLNAEGGEPSRSAWEAFRLNEVVDLPVVYNTCFRPELPPGRVLVLEGMPTLNAYTPAVVERTDGDASPFIDHVRRMLPHGRDADLLLHYMASVVQNPGRKFQWWPVVQGVKGNGKTLLLTAMMYSVGARYCHLVNPEAMQRTGNQFNSWINRRLFLGFEEIHTGEGQRHFTDMMKSTVTNTRIASEGKGAAQETVDNRANGMMLTNHSDAVPVDDDERRYGIFWCAQQSMDDLVRDGMDNGYFPKLYDWLNTGGLAIVAHFLATMPLQAAMDPARDMHRAPLTSSTSSAIDASRGRVEQEILEAIEEGRRGFAGGIVSSDALKHLFSFLKVNIAPRRFRQIMQSLGYDWHPALGKDGRVSTPLTDGTRPRLYVRRDHECLAWSAGVDVMHLFQQMLDGTVPASNVVAFPPR